MRNIHGVSIVVGEWLISCAEGRARRGDFSMVRRGWRDFLYLNNATAEAKAKVFLDLGKAVPSGTIENVGCELKPAPKRKWERDEE